MIWMYSVLGGVTGLICLLISDRLRKKDRERIEELEDEKRIHCKDAMLFANELREERRQCELLQGELEESEKLKKHYQSEMAMWQRMYFISLKENIKLAEQMRCRCSEVVEEDERKAKENA